MSAPTLDTKEETVLAAEDQRGFANFTRRLAETPELGVVLACVVVFVGICAAKSTFADVSNLQEMGRNLAEYGTLAIGESFVILTGGIDLSVGSLAAVSAVFSAYLVENQSVPLVPAILITLLVCAAVGFMHGWFITRLNVPPFVITLVTYTAGRGVAQAITQSVPVTITDNSFQEISRTQILGVPLPTFIFLVVGVVAWFVLERAYIGRQIYAVGGNREAARLAGINTSRRIVTSYMVSATLAGIVGIIIASRLGLGDPSVAQGYELQAIAAAVIGGVSLYGGRAASSASSPAASCWC